MKASKQKALWGQIQEFAKIQPLDRALLLSQRVVSPVGSQSPRSQALLKVRMKGKITVLLCWAGPERADVVQAGARTRQGQNSQGQTQWL